MFGLDTLQKLAGGAVKIGPSLLKAGVEAFKAEGGTWEKIKIFFGTFMKEMGDVEKDKEKITEEAEEKASQAVGQTMDSAEKEIELDKSGIEEEDAESFQEAFALTVSAKRSMSPEQQIYAENGFNKLKKAVEGDSEEILDLNEFKAVAATALSTLKALKAKYPDKDQLKAALDHIAEASENSNFPVAKLLQTSVLKVLKPEISSVSLVNPLDPAFDLRAKFGIDISALSGFGDALALLKEEELSAENKEKVVAAYSKYIIPNTTESDVVKVVEFVHKMVIEKPENLSTEQLAEIVSLVDAKDLERIIAIFTGKTEKTTS
ncbi:MAG: hypothetical protein WC651_04360 [Candidatus Gracilibacteria bacterium]|jgi:hypothetical protein